MRTHGSGVVAGEGYSVVLAQTNDAAIVSLSSKPHSGIPSVEVISLAPSMRQNPPMQIPFQANKRWKDRGIHHPCSKKQSDLCGEKEKRSTGSTHSIHELARELFSERRLTHSSFLSLPFRIAGSYSCEEKNRSLPENFWGLRVKHRVGCCATPILYGIVACLSS
jgi:hypothetical protein